jgi:hypothetical protein
MRIQLTGAELGDSPILTKGIVRRTAVPDFVCVKILVIRTDQNGVTIRQQPVRYFASKAMIPNITL